MLMSRQSIVTPLVVVSCMLGIAFMQFPRLQKLLNSRQYIPLATLEKELQQEKVRLDLLKQTPSFGYDNLMANWVYLNFLQYFGDDEIRERTGYSLSPEYFDIILKHDPRFLEAYIALSTSTSLYAGVPERSIALMSESLKSLSPHVPEKSYYIWRYKGIDELLFLGDAKASESSFLMAANWASQYEDEESKFVAFTSQKTAEFLSRNPNSIYAQIATWGMILTNPVDEKTRKRAIDAIEKLGGQVVINPDGTSSIKLPPQD
ncbi:hypothetical protein CLI64_03155 [Nostoc sp. CENA543]|uniref:hypothetical protein n=1 Tax=Nostoc sp. CENA543 TaxID=1869241 RepID=UPI000CA0ADB9|nr:hypothetical protein [Nostoc sp. CENA543]AUS99468.1 hypothetical protein CLI64_03155 [Nostoc sp. CENA543]